MGTIENSALPGCRDGIPAIHPPHTSEPIMLPDPLHPAIVHMPLTLAALLPLIVIAVMVGVRFGVPAQRSWRLVVVVLILLAGSAIVAVETGEDEEDAVEEVVDHDIIHEHEERAELFRNLSVLTLLIGFGGLAGGKLGAFSRGAGTGLVFALAVLAWRTGESGGDLVYQHGAANAYIESQSGGASVSDGEGHDDDGGHADDEDR